MMVKSKVKYIQSLSQKKQRDQDGVFVAEGPKIINELLSSGVVTVLELYALAGWIGSHDLPRHLPLPIIEEVDEVMLSRLSFLSTPHEVIGIFKKPSLKPFSFKGRLTIMLDTIQDPGNLGSIIRCADWFGISQVVCSMECADVYGPKTVQASMGSIGRVNVLYADLDSTITQNKNISVYAATLDGKDIYSISPFKEGFIIIGNESKGISDTILKLPVNKITIPRKGKAESLNAAVAAGIILSHIAR